MRCEDYKEFSVLCLKCATQDHPACAKKIADDMELVVITQSEYERLLVNDVHMEYLDAAGIDNATAYEYAIQLLNEDGYESFEEVVEKAIQKMVVHKVDLD